MTLYGQFRALKRQTSLFYISFAFCFLFFACAPLVQIGTAADPVFDMDFVPLTVACQVLLFTSVGLLFQHRLEKKRVLPSVIPVLNKSPKQHYLLLSLAIVGAGTLAVILFHDVLFSSRVDFSTFMETASGNPALALITQTFLQAFPFYAAAIGLRGALTENKKIWVFLFILLFGAASILNNPMIRPRYELAGLVFFFADYVLRGRMSIRLIALLMVLGVGFAPILNIFREVGPTRDSLWPQGFYDQTFLSYDYDAFETACYAVLSVAQNGIRWGANWLGAAFFFVPHTWWTEKPTQTAFVVYDTMSRYRFVGTHNLSTPLMAEGYVAFGFVGVILTTLLYWFALARLSLASLRKEDSFKRLAAAVLAGLIFILLRGSLIVALSAVAGGLVVGGIAWGILRMGGGSRKLQQGPIKTLS